MTIHLTPASPSPLSLALAQPSPVEPVPAVVALVVVGIAGHVAFAQQEIA